MDPTLEEVLQRFTLEYLDPNSISELRRIEHLRVLRLFASQLDHPLLDLTAQDLTLFIGDRLKNGVSPRTISKKHIGFIRVFAEWATSNGLIDLPRMEQLKFVRNPRGGSAILKPNPYTAKQVREFYAVMAAKYPRLPLTGRRSHAHRRFANQGRLDRHYWRHARRLQFEALVALALEEGLRRKEIFDATIPALHPDNDQIVVVTAKQEPGVVIRRAIPYTTHARRVVGEWLNFRRFLAPDHDCPWLMLDNVVAMSTNLGRPVELSDQLRPFRLKAMQESLMVFGTGWRWHRFRHTAATEWLRSGVPLEKVRVFMGHGNIETTLMYVELLKSDIDAAFSAAEDDFSRRLGLVDDENEAA